MTNRAVFPVKLIKDWRTAAFIDGLLTEERVLIFVGVALYIIALSIAVFFVTQQIRNFYRAGKKILVLSTMGLSLITLALLRKSSVYQKRSNLVIISSNIVPLSTALWCFRSRAIIEHHFLRITGPGLFNMLCHCRIQMVRTRVT